MTNQEIAIGNILVERIRQDTKWGEQNHDPAIWLSILMEEVGEASKAYLEGDGVGYVHEMIQVGAVVVAMLECSFRNVDKAWPDITALQQSQKEV